MALFFSGGATALPSSLRYTKMKTATNIYIFNLALADALATSTLPFQSVNYLMGTWPFGTILCKIVISIDYYNMFTSIFTLCTMSIDRYIAVCHPVKALDFRTPRNAKIVNICNWILSSAIGLPVMFTATTKYRQGSIDCTLTFSHPTWYWENLLKICVFIFAFILPVLIITVCYGLMILRLKSVRMLSGSKEKDRNLRRITRMVLVVVAVFIVCWTPIHIYVIIKALITIPETTFQTVSWHFCIALGYTNSCLNPVLYAFLDENFKRCFREFCIPTSSTIEQQNSTRMRQNTRDLPSTANTVDRTNHQGPAYCSSCSDPYLIYVPLVVFMSSRSLKFSGTNNLSNGYTTGCICAFLHGGAYSALRVPSSTGEQAAITAPRGKLLRFFSLTTQPPSINSTHVYQQLENLEAETAPLP
eukprot:bmy_18509T0